MYFSKHPDKQIHDAITDALERANAAGISGKEATPFLLDAISKITQGKSLATSILFLKIFPTIA